MKVKQIHRHDVFGLLTVDTEADSKGVSGDIKWNCRCHCGGFKQVTSYQLRRGLVKSCGCLRKKCVAQVGTVYGRLRVLNLESSPTGLVAHCACTCGKIIDLSAYSVVRGHTQSCGCLHSEHVKRMQQRRKLLTGDAARNTLFCSYKRMALKRKFEFSLTLEDFSALTLGNCAYCGVLPNQIFWSNAGHASECVYNGIDRVDNMLGYTVGNCVSCCGMCNKAKNKHTIADFDAWLRRIVLHRFGVVLKMLP